jgi:hypothetical protein
LLTEDDFAQLPGVKSSAKNMAAQMARIRNGEFDIIQLMAASGCFDRGLGETRLRSLWAQKPITFDKVWTVANKKEVISLVSDVPGCGPAFAKIYASGLPAFWSWLKESGAAYARPVKAKATRVGPLNGLTFCWTGYRDKEEEQWVIDNGGKVESFKSSTSVLFYREGGKASGKVEKAGHRAQVFAKYKAKTGG